MNQFLKANKKNEKAVVFGYQAIEGGVVETCQKVENSVVGGCKKIEDKFVGAFLTPDNDGAANMFITISTENA